MTLDEFKQKVAGHYPITKIQTTTQYVVRLGEGGSVILQYHNDKFTNFIVNGKEAEQIKQLLLK